MLKLSGLLAGLALAAAACGGDSLPTGVNSGDQPSADEVDLLVSELFGDLEDLSTTFAASRQPTLQLPAGLSLSMAGVPIDETINESHPCNGGGTVQVTGSVEGELDDETFEGAVDFDLEQSINSCVVVGETVTFTVSSEPDIGMTGTLEISETSFSLSFDIGGGLAFTTDDDRSGTCAIDMSLAVTATTDGENTTVTATVSGEVCGRNVNDL
jgi:hypothetical protein